VMNGRLPERMGNRSPWAAPQGCYRCRGDDDWLVISIEDDEEWAAFCAAVRHPEWKEDQRFVDALGRRDHHDELDVLIEGWTRGQDHIEAMHLLQRAGVKAGAVLNGKEILLDPHFRERGSFDTIEHPIVGRRLVNRQLIAKFDRFEPKVPGPAPLLGQHNREVLQGLLGLSDQEFTALEQENVTGTQPISEVPVEVWSAALKLPFEQFLEMGALRAIEPDYKEQLGL
jgi:crotonobetainyl-CoA:carnitine CoA-transferase CaiB-like acyl-CoA transferase